MALRLMTFDALHTIITPRLPIHVQYSQIFSPYLGNLNPDSIKRSFKVALKDVQEENPLFSVGAQAWWREVIRRTALGAGADEQALKESLHEIVPALMRRFSSKEGYKVFDDAIPTMLHLHSLGIRTAIVSNGDSRIRAVLQDLSFPKEVQPILLSEEEGVEKPSREIFIRALERVNAMGSEKAAILPEHCLHVGDELKADYFGALNAGFRPLLLRRDGPDGEHAHKELHETLQDVDVVKSLHAVVKYIIS